MVLYTVYYLDKLLRPSALFHRYDNFCVKKIKYIMYDVQDHSVLFNNADRPIICESGHFTHTWKAFT